MTVQELLKRKGNIVYSIDPDATVYESIEKMANLNIGALLVMREQKLVGIITERDYRNKVILMGRTSKNTPVKDIMVREVFCVNPTNSINLCMQIMTQKRIRHLPVVNQGEVTGVISIGDVVKSVIDHQKVEIKSLRNYIAGVYPA
ncbi:MAG: CBS domain-containing protein [Balneolaceae bacterium]